MKTFTTKHACALVLGCAGAVATLACGSSDRDDASSSEIVCRYETTSVNTANGLPAGPINDGCKQPTLAYWRACCQDGGAPK